MHPLKASPTTQKLSQPLKIPFNKPYMTGKELEYIRQAYDKGHLAGDGVFTQKCSQWLEDHIHCKRALLTHSGTAALEMAAMLTDIQPGDEIIMPSFTFVSTANAFVLRGGVPIFVDIRPDTLNLDESQIEAAITSKTKAIVPVHYSGIGCEMDPILDIARKYNLIVIEDAAHAVLAHYKGKPLGSLGHLAILSFHETKAIISGEGGALLINDERFIKRAEIIREKGTDRSAFFRGEVDKYTWQDIGSSYLPSELIAAFLFAQMEMAQDIIHRRIKIWDRYHNALEGLEMQGKIQRPRLPSNCVHNGHMYYILVQKPQLRDEVIGKLKEAGIMAVFHYVPLHLTPGGLKYGRAIGSLKLTQEVSDRLIRLPLWLGLESHFNVIIKTILAKMA